MPSHDIHERVDEAVLGEEHPDVHDFLDLTARSPGPRHREDGIHTTEAALAFASITGEFRKAQSGLLHILTDELANNEKLLDDLRDAPDEDHSERLGDIGSGDDVEIANLTMERLGAFALDIERQDESGIDTKYDISENIAEAVDAVLDQLSEMKSTTSDSTFVRNSDTYVYHNEDESLIEVGKHVIGGVARSEGIAERHVKGILGPLLQGTGSVSHNDDRVVTYKFDIHALDQQDVVSVADL